MSEPSLPKIKQCSQYKDYLVTGNGIILKSDGSILKQTVDRFGYHSVRVRIGNKRCREMTHRLVAKAFIPNPENKPEVHHKDSNVHNNRIENLEWVTAKENSRYSMLLGNKAKKLTINKVIRIKKYLQKGWSQYKVASKIGINQSCISDIATGKSWSWKQKQRR